MTILGIFLSNEIRTGGHIRCLELMEGLACRGNSVSVLLNADLAYEPKWFAAIRIQAPYRRKKLPPASFVFKHAVEEWLRKNTFPYKPDLLVVFSETHFKAAITVKKRLGIPIVFGIQSNAVRESIISLRENKLHPRAFVRAVYEYFHYAAYEQRIARNCDAIVLQSASDRDDFLSRVSGATKKLHIIGGNIGEPRCIDGTRGINASGSLRKVLFMGTLGERKGLGYLMEAVAILHREGHAELELHVAGPGSDEQKRRFEHHAMAGGFARAVRFYGRVPSTFPLMAECDLMVAPSLFDSYPDVILLALHAGIPVIGSRVGGIPEMLANDDLLFPVRDSSAIASILRRCLEEPGHYARLRSLCEARRTHFVFDWPEAWEKLAKEMLER
ncbi:MAG TPA: glycosyltransferase family 4 protein [bacterium]|nr:glycosyltransferase family 4 protein [bacterium]